MGEFSAAGGLSAVGSASRFAGRNVASKAAKSLGRHGTRLGFQPSSLITGQTAGPDFSGLHTFGTIMSVAGVLTGAIGSFYAAKTQKYQLQGQALSLEFERSIANLNSRAAERDAQAILEAGRQEKALTTLRHGQAIATQRASQAARGLQAGVGSVAEMAATSILAKDLDALTIDADTVRAANAARLRAVDLRSRGRLAGVGAANLRGTAGSVSPFLATTSSLLTGAGRVSRSISQGLRQNTLLSTLRSR